MLIRLSYLVRSMPFAYFYSNQVGDPRKLTKLINRAQTVQQIKQIIEKNQGQLNLVHMSAMLKKLNQKSPDQPLLQKVYQQVQTTLLNTSQPTATNARAIANIIGYTGNRGYGGINDCIGRIDYFKLVRFVNQKEFVMFLTGLLKLGIVDQVIGDKGLDRFLGEFVEKCENFGLLISLWRNLIRAGKCKQETNRILMTKILKCKPSQNLKDLGYLVYCYTQSPHIASQLPQLSKKIQQCSESILYTTRINIYELCIFVDHLVKISQKTTLKPTEEFASILRGQYVRIVRNGIDLRSLANGYMSLVNFGMGIDEDSYVCTVDRFGCLLETDNSVNGDYQSVTSLFLQLITTKPHSITSDEQGLNSGLYESLTLQNLVTLLKVFLFNPNTPPILHLSPKQYQKLLYSFHLYKKQDPTFDLTSQQTQLLTQSLLLKPQLNELQATSIIASFNSLGIRSQAICGYFRERLSGREGLGRSCWIGLRKGDCFGCQIKEKGKDGDDGGSL